MIIVYRDTSAFGVESSVKSFKKWSQCCQMASLHLGITVMAQIPLAKWLKGKIFLVSSKTESSKKKGFLWRALAGKIIIVRVVHHLWQSTGLFTNYGEILDGKRAMRSHPNNQYHFSNIIWSILKQHWKLTVTNIKMKVIEH